PGAAAPIAPPVFCNATNLLWLLSLLALAIYISTTPVVSYKIQVADIVGFDVEQQKGTAEYWMINLLVGAIPSFQYFMVPPNVYKSAAIIAIILSGLDALGNAEKA